jgi:hypothetical protein
VDTKSELRQYDKPDAMIQPLRFVQWPTKYEDMEDLEQEDALDWWYRTVDDYMTREIMFPGDRVPAVAGLAKAFASRTGFRYIGGLWEEDLPRCLFSNACCSKVPTEIFIQRKRVRPTKTEVVPRIRLVPRAISLDVFGTPLQLRSRITKASTHLLIST